MLVEVVVASIVVVVGRSRCSSAAADRARDIALFLRTQSQFFQIPALVLILSLMTFTAYSGHPTFGLQPTNIKSLPGPERPIRQHLRAL